MLQRANQYVMRNEGMVKGLEGKRDAIGGSCKIEEISTLIEKQGGTPLIRSLQGTVFLAEKEVEPSLLR